MIPPGTAITIQDPDFGKEPTAKSVSQKYLGKPITEPTFHALKAELQRIRYTQVSIRDKNWGRDAAKQLLVMMKFIKYFTKNMGDRYEDRYITRITRQKGTRSVESISCKFEVTEAKEKRIDR